MILKWFSHVLIVKCQPWQNFLFLFHAAKTFSVTWNIRWEIWLKMPKTSQRRKTSDANTATIRISQARSHWYLNLSEKTKLWFDVFLSNGLIDIGSHRFQTLLCIQRKVPTFSPPPPASYKFFILISMRDSTVKLQHQTPLNNHYAKEQHNMHVGEMYVHVCLSKFNFFLLIRNITALCQTTANKLTMMVSTSL